MYERYFDANKNPANFGGFEYGYCGDTPQTVNEEDKESV